jgi:hypothetical protein
MTLGNIYAPTFGTHIAVSANHLRFALDTARLSRCACSIFELLGCIRVRSCIM